MLRIVLLVLYLVAMTANQHGGGLDPNGLNAGGGWDPNGLDIGGGCDPDGLKTGGCNPNG